jgi:hypothetical protein
MRSSCREEVVEAFDALEADLHRALQLSFDALTTPERLSLLERCERFRRQLPAVEHPLINQVGAQAGETELGGKLAHTLADRLRITRADASRRIHEAADLGERTAITGEPLEPVLAATASAQRDGQIGAGQVAVIRSFVHRLPDFVDVETRQQAEAQLARLGGQHRPDELSKLADKLTDCLNPDGNFTDDDRTVAAFDHLTLAIRNFHNAGDATTIRVPLAVPAATIAGFALSPLSASGVPEISTAITRLREVLGEATYESLARKGETMTTAAMVTYAYDQIDQARAELEHSG